MGGRIQVAALGATGPVIRCAHDRGEAAASPNAPRTSAAPPAQRVRGKPRSTLLVDGSGQREVTTFARV